MNVAQRRKINRENGQKSRGPKTPEGKEASRRNALKHGLRAETLTLPNDDPDAIRARAEEWDDYFQPRNPAQRHLVDLCVQATLLSDRCQRHHTAILSKQIREAVPKFDQECRDEVERLGALLPTEPAAAVRSLERSAAGCRWLLTSWRTLIEALDDIGYWNNDERDLAVRLHGNDPDDLQGSVLSYSTRLFNLLAAGSYNVDALDWLLDPERVPERLLDMYLGCNPSELPDAETCRSYLRQKAVAAYHRLLPIEEALRVEIEEPNRAEAADRALLPNDPNDARLFLRYHAESRTAFHRAYNALVKALDSDDAENDEATSDPDAPLSVEEIMRRTEAISAAADRFGVPGTTFPESSPAPETPPYDASDVVSPNEPNPAPQAPSTSVSEATSGDSCASVLASGCPGFGTPTPCTFTLDLAPGVGVPNPCHPAPEPTPSDPLAAVSPNEPKPGPEAPSTAVQETTSDDASAPLSGSSSAPGGPMAGVDRRDSLVVRQTWGISPQPTEERSPECPTRSFDTVCPS